MRLGFFSDVHSNLEALNAVLDAFGDELQCLGSAGSESILYDLRSALASPPAALSIAPTAAGTVISWPGDGYRLLGAESLDGPWIELGVTSPVVLTPSAPQRYYRLVCP